jgi:hypothetical protein
MREPLVRQFDRVALQFDLGSELVTTAAPEWAALLEVALRRLQLSLGCVARLHECAALVLQEA